MYPYAPLQFALNITNNKSEIARMKHSGLPTWKNLDKKQYSRDDIDIVSNIWDTNPQVDALVTWLEDGDGLYDIAFDIIMLNYDIRKIVNSLLYRDMGIDIIQQYLSRSGYGAIPIEALEIYKKYFWRWELLEAKEVEHFFTSLGSSEEQVYTIAKSSRLYELENALQIVPDISTNDFLKTVLSYGIHHLNQAFFKQTPKPGSAIYPALKAAELMIKLEELDQANKQSNDLATLLGLHIKYEEDNNIRDMTDLKEDSNGN